MNWSIERRFSKGIFLTPKLLGYDLDDEGQLVINPDEAETVKVIYYLYVNGWSGQEIADLLTEYGRKTKLGNEVWNSGSIDRIIENERHCGDVRSRKTYTPDFKNHKSVKNRQNRKQVIQRDHHDPIVTREVYNAANLLKSSQVYTTQRRPIPVLSVVDDGILRGYVPVDKSWTGFSAEEYQTACESVDQVRQETEREESLLGFGNFQLVRAAFFPSNAYPSMTISNGKLRFNTACLKKFEDVEYVELLLNTVANAIAIRPCEKDNPNAIHWGRLREERWVASTLGCKGFAKMLFGLMDWDAEAQYKFTGRFITNGEDKLLVFELDEPVITKTEEQVVVPETADDQPDAVEEEIVIRERVQIYPESWKTTFGKKINVLKQVHYAGDWDVLRPATELEEMNLLTAAELDVLMKEAETIMEGWKTVA